VTVPSEPVPVPEVVADIAAGRPVVAVWVNELGGVTFELDGGREYVKVSSPEWTHHLVAERERLAWAAPHPGGTLGRRPSLGRRSAHGGAGDRSGFASAARRAARRRVSVRPTAVGDRCTAYRPARVCHGDACAPNTLIGDDCRCCGHVDLGDLGIADRWADIAIAMLSLSWNYPGSWEGELLDAYGVDADPARIEAYQRLWNAGDISSH
jgi:kanamycin kinase